MNRSPRSLKPPCLSIPSSLLSFAALSSRAVEAADLPDHLVLVRLGEEGGHGQRNHLARRRLAFREIPLFVPQSPERLLQVEGDRVMDRGGGPVLPQGGDPGVPP